MMSKLSLHRLILLIFLALILLVGTGYAAQVGSGMTDSSESNPEQEIEADITLDLSGFSSDLDDKTIIIKHGSSKNNGLTVFGSMHIPAGEIYEDDIIIVGGTGNIEGHVRGDLVVFGGTAEVSGQIDGDLFVMGGSLTLLSSAHVEGNLVTLGGVVTREDGAYIEDDSVTIGGTDKDAHVISFDPDFSSIMGKLNIFILLTWLILALVTTLIFMRPLESTVNATYYRPFQALLTGFLFHVISLLILLALTILVIGIPLAGLGLIIWACVAIFGTVAGFILMGKIVLLKLGKGQTSVMLLMLLGLLILSVLRFFPLFTGIIFWYLWAMVGVGGTVLSRFGSNKPWFAPRPTLEQYAKRSESPVPMASPVTPPVPATVQSMVPGSRLPVEPKPVPVVNPDELDLDQESDLEKTNT